MDFRGACVAALWLACALRMASAADRVDLAEALQKPWQTLKLDFEHHGGDYDAFGPCLSIQRLEDKRVVLSFADMAVGSEKPLVPWRFMTEAEVAQVVARTIQFWETARKELSVAEQRAAMKGPSLEEQIAKLPAEQQAAVRKVIRRAGRLESTMKVRISIPDGREDEVFEETMGESENDWVKFLKETAGPKG